MKALACCILFSFGATILNAQIRVGAVGGMNMSSFTVPGNIISTAARKTRFGLTIGAAAELQLSQQWSVRIEPRYIQKGFRTEFTDALGTNKSTETLNYFELPLTAVIRFGEFDISPFFFAGPDFAFLLSASDDVTLSNGQSFPPLNTKSNYKSFEFALEGGFGVEYTLTSSMSVLGIARYSYGLSNVYQVPTYDGKTRDFQLQLGVLYTLP